MARSALILGGGFAGIEAAIQLRAAGLDVTLVSDRPFLFVYPTSIWVATGERSVAETSLDLAAVARRHGFSLTVGAVTSVSGARRAAVVDGRELAADHLVVALGGGRLVPPGVEHTRTLGGAPENVERLRDALGALIARGAGRVAMGFGGNPKDGSAVRGGPVFEVMFNVDRLLRRRGVRQAFELTFFAPMPSPGERMGKKAVAAIQSSFDRLGIARRFGKKIDRFEAGGVVFEDQSRLDADLVVFLPAGAGHPVLQASDLPRNEAGFVTIDEGCAVPGLPGVWAIGDAAALQGPDWRAKQGHVAEVMARTVAANVRAAEAGSPARESYVPHLGITCLMDMGRDAAFVHRDDRREQVIPLPLFGHLLKKAWGGYYAGSKLGRLPRLPGL